MHRIDGAGIAEDLHGAGKDGFTVGNPGAAIPATTVTADIMNALQEEICAVIESAGIVLSKPDNTQLLDALTQIIEDAAELVAYSIVRGTSLGLQAVSGLTDADFISIPAGVEHIEIYGRQCGVNNASAGDICLRLGDASSFISTGYRGTTRSDGGAMDVWAAQAFVTTGFNHTYNCSFKITLDKEPGSNVWYIEMQSNRDDSSGGHNHMWGNGYVDVGAALTRVRLKPEVATYTFDGGNIFAKYW